MDSQAEGNHYERHVGTLENPPPRRVARKWAEEEDETVYNKPEFRKRETGSITGTGSR